MKTIELNGRYFLSDANGLRVKGHLPGCFYLDLMDNKVINDPFFSTNEKEYESLAHNDYTYSRTFMVDEEILSFNNVIFEGSGIDTICSIYINDKLIGNTSNINRTYKFNVKNFLIQGENSLRMDFKDPYKYAKDKQDADTHLKSKDNTKAFIRKTPCHFGWDWGPILTPTGVMGNLRIKAYNYKIEDIRIIQKHQDGKVTLHLETMVNEFADNLSLLLEITNPNNEKENYQLVRVNNKFEIDIEINNPLLWWPNGLGNQNLYQLDVTLSINDNIIDKEHKQIGLRTITLDRSLDEDGEQFRFVVNGVNIFAKGCDWIPSDSFVTRSKRKDIEFYMKSIHDANMNMLRVWGGGNYESEDFYDLCDLYGILVWQDCIFACNLYPFHDEEFTNNVHEEIIDNVKRIRHRASLALWCGNNENDIRFPLTRDKLVAKTNKYFYYDTLKEWINDLDGITPYWPGSPSSGKAHIRIQDFRKGKLSGDSHLWNIWHGMLPIEGFKKFPTRFCSEFGMESMPSLNTIRKFNPNEKPSLFDDVMVLHQKSKGGNAKMLYYLLQKYRNPKIFDDFCYLSQVVQSNAMRYATECWKRNIGKQNGALMWQLNDCWPVASWSIVDYNKDFKATLYHAKDFNKTLMISNDYYDDKAFLYVINELTTPFELTLKYQFVKFDGSVVKEDSTIFTINQYESKKIVELVYKSLLDNDLINNVYLKASLIGNNETIDEKLYLLVADNIANLNKSNIKYDLTLDNDILTITLKTDTYSRYVFVDTQYRADNFSDNFFDLEANTEKTITVKVTSLKLEEIKESLIIKDLSNVEPLGTLKDDKKVKKEMFKKDHNYLTYYFYNPLIGFCAKKGAKI